MQNFIFNQSGLKEAKSTGLNRLDEAFRLKQSRTHFFNCEPYCGGTALALELVQTQIESGFFVLYFDIKDSLIEARMHGLDRSKFLIAKPIDQAGLIAIAHRVSAFPEPITLVLDHVEYITKDLDSLITQLRGVAPLATIMCFYQEGRFGKRPDTTNGLLINLKNVKNHYVDRERMGNFLEIQGPLGKVVCYIQHETGRISRVYEKYIAAIEENKISSSGNFDVLGETIKGFWNAIAFEATKMRNK